jgi:hypothetical protein
VATPPPPSRRLRRRIGIPLGAALLLTTMLQSATIRAAHAYNVWDCRTADRVISYSVSTTELAGRDYFALANRAVTAWANSATPLIYSEVSLESQRDVLIGGLNYGNTDFNAITGPYPACRNSYRGILPRIYTYVRLNTNYTNNTKAFPSSRVLYIIEHELGHLAGLAHPVFATPPVPYCPPVAPAVMLPSEVGYSLCGYREIRSDDENGVNALY